MKELVELEAAFVAFHASGSEIERIDIGHAPSGMHDEVGLVALALVTRGGVNRKAAGSLLDRFDTRACPDIDPELARFRHQ